MSDVALYPAFEGYSVNVIADYNRQRSSALMDLLKILDVVSRVVSPTMRYLEEDPAALRATDMFIVDVTDYPNFVEEVFRFDSLSRPAFKVFIDHDYDNDRASYCDRLGYPYYAYSGEVENVARYIRDHAVDLKAEEMNRYPAGSISTYGEFAGRLEHIADGLAALRINSLSDHIAEIRSVAGRLHLRELHQENQDVVEVQIQARQIIQALPAIYDAIENSKLASIIVSGVVAYIATGGGWSAVFSQALALGAMQGKDAFIAVVSRLRIGNDFVEGPKPEAKRRGPRKKTT